MSAEEHKELNGAFHFNVNRTSSKTNCSENNTSLGFIHLKKSEKSLNNFDEHMLQVFGLTCHLETNASLCLECNCCCDCTCFCKQDKQMAQLAGALKCLEGKHCALWLHFCAAFESILRLTSVVPCPIRSRWSFQPENSWIWFLNMLSWKFIFGNTFDVTKDRATQARHFEPVGFEFGPTRENLWIFKNAQVQNVRLPLATAAGCVDRKAKRACSMLALVIASTSNDHFVVSQCVALVGNCSRSTKKHG